MATDSMDSLLNNKTIEDQSIHQKLFQIIGQYTIRHTSNFIDEETYLLSNKKSI